MFSNNEEFLIVGYSFGSLLALGFANILESNGVKGSVTMVDGSPQFVSTLAGYNFGGKAEKELNSTYVFYTIRHFFGEEYKDIEKEALKLPSWEDQMNFVGESMSSRSKINKINSVEMLHAILRRIKMSLNADKHPYPTLSKTPISLIKCSQPSVTNIDYDYGLGKLAKNEVKTIICDGDHASILLNQEFADILQERL